MPPLTRVAVEKASGKSFGIVDDPAELIAARQDRLRGLDLASSSTKAKRSTLGKAGEAGAGGSSSGIAPGASTLGGRLESGVSALPELGAEGTSTSAVRTAGDSSISAAPASVVRSHAAVSAGDLAVSGASKSGSSIHYQSFPTQVTWTAPIGTKQTYKVYQRSDINWEQVRTSGKREFIGKTNKEAARAGLAPQLPDGNFATLHHLGQDSRGGLVEASRRLHDFNSLKLPSGKTAFDVLHSQHGSKAKHPEYPVDHKVFQLESAKYWQERIKEVIKNGQ